jgi:hypothetical protein
MMSQSIRAALLLLLNCSLSSSPSAPSTADEQPGATPEHELEAVLCADRPRCSLASRQEIEGLSGSELLTLRIAERDDLPPDEERCVRREYWLARAIGNVLLSVDCEAQWGADGQGPAQLELIAERLHIRYVEFQAGDNCEIVDATINLSSVTVERHARQDGTVTQDRCQAGAAAILPDPPGGDGTASRPLLVLHRP